MQLRFDALPEEVLSAKNNELCCALENIDNDTELGVNCGDALLSISTIMRKTWAWEIAN